MTRRLLVLMIETVPAVWLATNSRSPFGVRAQPLGSVPTGIVLMTLRVVGEITDTVPSAPLVTKMFPPRGSTATQWGSWPTGISATFLRLRPCARTSKSVTLSASWLTLTKRVPFPVSAMLVERVGAAPPSAERPKSAKPVSATMVPLARRSV